MEFWESELEAKIDQTSIKKRSDYGKASFGIDFLSTLLEFWTYFGSLFWKHFRLSFETSFPNPFWIAFGLILGSFWGQV